MPRMVDYLGFAVRFQHNFTSCVPVQLLQIATGNPHPDLQAILLRLLRRFPGNVSIFRFVEVLLRHAGASGHTMAYLYTLYKFQSISFSCLSCFAVFPSTLPHWLQDKGQGALGGAIGMLKTIYNNLQTLYHCVVIALTEAPAIFIVTV